MKILAGLWHCFTNMTNCFSKCLAARPFYHLSNMFPSNRISSRISMAIVIGEFLDTSRIKNLNEVHMPRRLSTENYPYIYISLSYISMAMASHQQSPASYPFVSHPPSSSNSLDSAKSASPATPERSPVRMVGEVYGIPVKLMIFFDNSPRYHAVSIYRRGHPRSRFMPLPADKQIAQNPHHSWGLSAYYSPKCIYTPKIQNLLITV